MLSRKAELDPGAYLVGSHSSSVLLPLPYSCYGLVIGCPKAEGENKGSGTDPSGSSLSTALCLV